MQLTKKILTLCMAVAITMSACKKNNVDTPANPEVPVIEAIKGKVVLPVGSAVDVNTFSVLSNTDEEKVTDGEFSVDVCGKYTSLYVTNPSGQVVLMGYKYPGSANNDITPQTSAIGMVMMSPAVLSLTEQAKITIINKLSTDNNFNALVAEINKGFNAGRPLFDTTNTTLIDAFDKLFQTAVARGGNTPKELPVNMYRTGTGGRTFTFQNSGTTYSTVIGIYKDKEYLDKVVVEGKNFFSSSYTDALSGKAITLGDPVDYQYPLKGDGDFTFKFRTGKPGYGDGSPEHDEAFYQNLTQFCMNLLSTLSPEYTSCFGFFRGRLYETFKTITDLKSSSNLSPAIALEIAWNFSAGSMKDLIKNCTNNSPSPTWLKWVDKFTSSLNLYSKAAAIANTGLFAYQWASAEPVIDTCFKATGDVVKPVKCGCDISSFTDPRDNQTYKTVKIGTQTWFAENLRYSGNLPNIANNTQWYENSFTAVPGRQIPALCYYNNGTLYNWFAVISGNICPPGWHVPSDAEWTTLTNFLGDADGPVGGMMKSTQSWLAPNTDATNSSCFSGLPGGGRNSAGGEFSGAGTQGMWWTTTKSVDLPSVVFIITRTLSSSSVEMSGGSVHPNDGHSVRCVKD